MDVGNIIIKRAADLREKSRQIGRTVYSAFLDPSEQATLLGLRSDKEVGLSLWGGYDHAERKIVAFFPVDEQPENEDYPVSVVKVNLPEGHGLVHRDFLGSIMALGVKREQIGDIILQPYGGAVICTEAIAKYINQNLTKIGKINASVEIVPLSSVEPPKKEVKEVRGTVASARLDAVLSLATKKSRGQSATEIEGKLVNVNFKPVTDSAHKLRQGDIVSCRGFGRFEYAGDNGVTKKGRLSVTIRIFT